MAVYLLELPSEGGQVRKDEVRKMLVEADDATEAKQAAASLTGGDQVWTVAGVTATDITTLASADYEGWTFKVTIREPSLGGRAGVIEEVTHTGIAADAIDDVGDALVILLNATASIANAAYVSATNTLTAAAVADGLGDKSLQVEVLPPNHDGEPIAAMVGAITDEGIAAADLTVVLEEPTAIPTIYGTFK